MRLLRKLNGKIETLLRKNIGVLILLSAVLLGVFFFFITVGNIHTETYEIERFSIAETTIRSPITIKNEQETERKMRETVQSVQDRYEVSEKVTQERVGFIEEIFEAISKLEADHEQEEGEAPLTDHEKLRGLKEILSEEIIESVSDNTLIAILQQPEEIRQAGKEVFINGLQDTMEGGVRSETLLSARANVKQTIEYSDLEEGIKTPLTQLSDFAVVDNSFFDPDKTSEARKEAASTVDPVFISAGEVIVREGQTITNEIYEKLNLVGLLDKERNIFPLLGLTSLIVMLSGFIVIEMFRTLRGDRKDFGKVISIFLVCIIVVALMKVVSIYTTQTNQLFYVTPIAAGVLLIKIMISERTAIVLSVVFAILGSVIFNGEIAGSLNMEAGVYFLFSQLAGIVLLLNMKDRQAIFKGGIGIAVANVMTVMVFLFLSFEKYTWMDFLFHTSFALASAFMAAVLTIGLLPFFETVLGILSDIKLLQLTNPNQPLLKKLLTEAPGTYHHSVMVANISETACEAIGANGLLARVGAYYHDMGKTVRAHYFIENQLSIRNPHDFISPKDSADIIIAHPYDGAAMLEKHKFPREIIDIAKEHHGTTLLKFFYYKEKESNPDVDEREFRYPGPKPQTKEAAIICICDSVEAAVRSLKEPTEEKIVEIVSSIVKDRLTDGQLNECPLTLKELHTIQTAICDSLKGIFHSRIQYPMKEAK